MPQPPRRGFLSIFRSGGLAKMMDYCILPAPHGRYRGQGLTGFPLFALGAACGRDTVPFPHSSRPCRPDRPTAPITARARDPLAARGVAVSACQEGLPCLPPTPPPRFQPLSTISLHINSGRPSGTRRWKGTRPTSCNLICRPNTRPVTSRSTPRKSADPIPYPSPRESPSWSRTIRQQR